jgi:hypothetical protein
MVSAATRATRSASTRSLSFRYASALGFSAVGASGATGVSPNCARASSFRASNQSRKSRVETQSSSL